MERVTVSVSFSLKDLKRLDDWKDARRQTRSAAIMSLLDLATAQQAMGQLERGEVEPAGYEDFRAQLSRLEKARAALERATETEPLRDESEHAQLCRNPDLERRLRLAREAQEKALAGENAGAFDVTPEPTPQIWKKRDPYSQVEEWDSDGVAQDPPQDDVDQRRKGRR